ncbi:MAG: 50S ribosomal protein L32 [Pseudomonadota bacterium]
MGLPKRKTSKSCRDKRKSQWKATAPILSSCPQCHEPKLPHRAGLACGTYNGRTVKAEEV